MQLKRASHRMFIWSRPHICSKMKLTEHSVGLVKARKKKRGRKKFFLFKKKSKTQIKLKSKEREGRFNPETHIRSNNKSGLASINYKTVLCELKVCKHVGTPPSCKEREKKKG